MSKDIKSTGPRGGKKPFINIRLRRATHTIVSVFAARNGLKSLDAAIMRKFSNERE